MGRYNAFSVLNLGQTQMPSDRSISLRTSSIRSEEPFQIIISWKDKTKQQKPVQ